jgi:putative NADPH-quinone reductase
MPTYDQGNSFIKAQSAVVDPENYFDKTRRRPVKVLIVFAHPELKSFNGALFQQAIATLKAAGHDVQYSDLYAMGFDPVSNRHNFNSTKDPNYFKQQLEEMYATDVKGFVPEIEVELQKLEWCDLMIWQFPLWWFSVPAILKGWVDRVFAMGRVYGNGYIYETGRFRGKKAMLSLTIGGTKENYLEDGLNGDIHAILRPIQRGILQFTGFDVLSPHIVYAPVRQTDDVRQDILDRFSHRLQTIEAELAIAVGKY